MVSEGAVGTVPQMVAELKNQKVKWKVYSFSELRLERWGANPQDSTASRLQTIIVMLMTFKNYSYLRL